MLNSDQVFDQIQKIAGNPKRTVKKALLPHDQLFKTILLFAYNPFYTYGIKFGDEPIGKGRKRFNAHTWWILQHLRTRKLTGSRARNITHQHLLSLTSKSSWVFQCILQKDLRCGISIATINERYPGLIPVQKVMKAESYDPSRVTFPCYVSAKINGLRSVYRGGELFYGRGKKIIGLDHICRALAHLPGPIDGEMVVPGVDFDTGSGMIRSHKPTPTAIYCPFDYPMYDTAEFHVRYHNLLLALPKDNPNIRVIPHIRVKNEEQINDYYLKCRATGIEGVVVKSVNHIYQYKRTFDWLKIKPEDTKDVKCIGVYEGKGRNRGRLGGIVVRFGGETDRVGSGFSDTQRDAFFKQPDLIVGRTVEVLFMEKTSNDSMRHSRFIRVRYDK